MPLPHCPIKSDHRLPAGFPPRIAHPCRRIVIGVGRSEVTEEYQLYSSSTVYFSQEAEEHPSRRAVSLGPTVSRAITEDDDPSSSDLDIDHEDSETSHARRRNRASVLRGRRASVDLHNFHRDVVSHHATTHIPSPAYNPSIENTPEESPASSVANFSTTHLAPPPDQGPTSRPRSLSYVRPSPSPPHRERRPTTSGGINGSVPCSPASQRRASQALEDFRRALRSDPSVASVRPTPSIDTSAPASPILTPSSHTPPNETPNRLSPSRKPYGSDGSTHGRRSSKSRFSLSAISDAIIDSVRSHSTSAPKRRNEGTPVRTDVHDCERSGESMRGRSREKGKGKDLTHALIKVSEAFGLEPEEGKGSRDGWKEFKKGKLPPNVVAGFPGPSW